MSLFTHIYQNEDFAVIDLSLSCAVSVIPRSVWKADDVQIREKLHKPADKLIIHHTALWSCWSQTQSISQLKHIQHLHIHERSFNDIGYKFVNIVINVPVYCLAVLCLIG